MTNKGNNNDEGWWFLIGFVWRVGEHLHYEDAYCWETPANMPRLLRGDQGSFMGWWGGIVEVSVVLYVRVSWFN